MYKENKLFHTPPDDTKIWRYMDFTKFVDILAKSKLFFSRADKLEDPFEGSYTQANIKYRNENIDNFFRKETWNLIPRKGFEKRWGDICRNKKKFVTLSCWNKSEYESPVLWKLYCSGLEGIAIQSTIERFKESLKGERKEIYIGDVQYIDFSKDPEGKHDINLIRPFINKGKSYEYEHEVRGVIDFLGYKIENNNLVPRRILAGYYANINVESLIEKVYISPVSPKWKRGLVKSVMTKYGLSKQVLHSDLNNLKNPLY